MTTLTLIQEAGGLDQGRILWYREHAPLRFLPSPRQSFGRLGARAQSAQLCIEGAQYPWPEDVGRGVVWLDEWVPKWVGRIRLDRLDITTQYGCVLGQLFGSYSAALGITQHDDLWAWEHGFTVRRQPYGNVLDMRSTEELFNSLTALWYTIIGARKGEIHATHP